MGGAMKINVYHTLGEPPFTKKPNIMSGHQVFRRATLYQYGDTLIVSVLDTLEPPTYLPHWAQLSAIVRDRVQPSIIIKITHSCSISASSARKSPTEWNDRKCLRSGALTDFWRTRRRNGHTRAQLSAINGKLSMVGLLSDRYTAHAFNKNLRVSPILL